jgi:POT family proton-dependent oligopeptide transporter
MQGILLIYLYYEASRGGLGIDKAVASGILGAYGGGVCLATILGAWLGVAAIVVGGVLLAIVKPVRRLMNGVH